MNFAISCSVASRALRVSLLGILTLFLLPSCQSMVYEPEGDCETVYELQFVYDRNLKWADAFASEVHAVTLNVFDVNTGELVLSKTEQGEELEREGYAMRLDIPAGDYEMVAWCGEGAHDGGYSFVPVVPSKGFNSVVDVKCRLSHNHLPDGEHCFVDQENGIGHLYHGRITASLPAEEGSKVRLKMPLTKNTNSLKIVLQSLKGKVISPDDYDFTISDDNGYMDYDNSLIPDETLLYKPWSVEGGSAEILNPDYDNIESPDQAPASGGSPMSAVVADLRIGRLMADHRPILTVRDKTKENKVLFSFPIIDYALMVKGKYRHPMDDQEYLDRQDEYNMTFFLDENGEWNKIYIYINKWKVVVNEADLH